MKTFDEAYGDGSLEELREELSLPDFEVVLMVEGVDLGEEHLKVWWEGEGSHGIVHFRYSDPEVWVYSQYGMAPERQGLYARTSLRFCEAAIKRGVERFEVVNSTPAARAALEASGWTYDGYEASVTPEVLAEYGRARE